MYGIFFDVRGHIGDECTSSVGKGTIRGKIHGNILPELFMDGSMTSIDLPSQSHCYSLGL